MFNIKRKGEKCYKDSSLNGYIEYILSNELKIKKIKKVINKNFHTQIEVSFVSLDSSMNYGINSLLDKKTTITKEEVVNIKKNISVKTRKIFPNLTEKIQLDKKHLIELLDCIVKEISFYNQNKIFLTPRDIVGEEALKKERKEYKSEQRKKKAKKRRRKRNKIKVTESVRKELLPQTIVFETVDTKLKHHIVAVSFSQQLLSKVYFVLSDVEKESFLNLIDEEKNKFENILLGDSKCLRIFLKKDKLRSIEDEGVRNLFIILTQLVCIPKSIERIFETVSKKETVLDILEKTLLINEKFILLLSEFMERVENLIGCSIQPFDNTNRLKLRNTALSKEDVFNFLNIGVEKNDSYYKRKEIMLQANKQKEQITQTEIVSHLLKQKRNEQNKFKGN